MFWSSVSKAATQAVSGARVVGTTLIVKRLNPYFKSFQEFSTLNDVIQRISSQKNKDKYFMAEIIKENLEIDNQGFTLLIDFVQKHSLTLSCLSAIIIRSELCYDNLSKEQIQTIINTFQSAPTPKKAADFALIIEFLKNSDERLLNKLDLTVFLKDLNSVLLEERADLDLGLIIGWIRDLQNIRSNIEFNGVLTEKLYDELYDKTSQEWLQILEVYSLSGKLDIELLQELDKQLNRQLLGLNDQLYAHFLDICAAKDFKPSLFEELNKELQNRILAAGRIIAVDYLESLQYTQPQFLKNIFDSLIQKGVDVRVIEESSGKKKDLLRFFGVLPPLNEDLVKMIQVRNVSGIIRYIQTRKQDNDKEHSLSVHEMFLISKFIKDTEMNGKKRASKELNLPSLISDQEIQLITETNAIVNKFMKEKGQRNIHSLRTFLEINCISHSLGFDKQATECLQSTFSQFKSQFAKVFSLPVLTEFGTINNELFIKIIPEYSNYIVTKYIQRNQLNFNEALIIMRCVHQVQELYIEQNAKYINKEFVYGVKGIVRLAILSFQKRVYSNFSEVKSKKPNVENPFMEKDHLSKAKSRFQEEDKLIIDFAKDLTTTEIDQLLELFQLANSMNVGSKEFYDSLPLFALQYYDVLQLEQKAQVAYFISTIDCSDEKIEKAIEKSIQNNHSFTLVQAVRFLSFLTTRYCLNEEIWKKLISFVQLYQRDIEGSLTKEMKLSLTLSIECLRVEQPHILFPLQQSVSEHLSIVFSKNESQAVKRQTKFTEAISYFLSRLGYYIEKEQRQSIFSFMFSQHSSQSYFIVLDKNSFIGDTKTQRAKISVMIRILTKLNLKLKILNVYDWASKEKRHEKVAYLKSKVKGMAFDPEKQKKKTHFNF